MQNQLQIISWIYWNGWPKATEPNIVPIIPSYGGEGVQKKTKSTLNGSVFPPTPLPIDSSRFWTFQVQVV